MEDCNALVSDCIVVSCCCECLILQLFVLIFVHLPRKLVRKTKEYAKKKLARRRKKTKGDERIGNHRQKHDVIGYENGQGRSMPSILELEGISMSRLHRWGNCSDEVERVLWELSMKGEFAFGSFWGENQQQNVGLLCCKCSNNNNNIMTKENNALEFGGNHVVKFRFIELLGRDFEPS